MKPIFKAILALILALPLAAQSPSATLRHFGERSGRMYDGLQALLREEGLVEMVVEFRSMRTDSPQYPETARELRLSPGSSWALMDDLGRCLLQGSELPTAEELRKALDDAGIKSQVAVLLDFLKQHPYHLDARVDLLRMLRGVAESRTRRALQLDAQSTLDLARRGTPYGRYRMASDSIPFDPKLFEGKKLEPEQDALIWGAYAQELQTIFANEDWRALIKFPSPWFTDIPLEVCSPMMVQSYARHMKKIEDFFEEQGNSYYAWCWYSWMRCIARQGSAKPQPIVTLLERLKTPYGYQTETIGDIPLALLILEERENGNWNTLATELWARWPWFRYIEEYWTTNMELIEEEAEKKARLDASWLDRIKPLLESLILTNRLEEADRVVVYLTRLNARLDIQRRAAELALDCGRKDLDAKWRSLSIPEKSTLPSLDDLESLYFQITPRGGIYLVVTNGEKDSEQIDMLLEQNRFFEWDINKVVLSPEQSILLCQEEGWPKDGTYWALREKSGTLAHGPGLPSATEIHQTLQESAVEKGTDVLRRFIREHLNNMDAKLSLQHELRRVAEQKTKDRLGTMAGQDTALALSEEDDEAIWGEFTSRLNPLLLTLLEHSMPWVWVESFCESDYFIHSQKMKDVARSLLPNVEASLRRQPNNDNLWQIWSALAELEGLRRYRDLKETLVPSPSKDRISSIPLEMSRKILVKRYRARSNWRELADVLEPYWETFRDRVRSQTDWIWEDTIQYLLEAYIRMGKESDANSLLTAWGQSPAWETVLQGAIALAEKCDREALAERWKRLK